MVRNFRMHKTINSWNNSRNDRRAKPLFSLYSIGLDSKMHIRKSNDKLDGWRGGVIINSVASEHVLRNETLLRDVQQVHHCRGIDEWDESYMNTDRLRQYGSGKYSVYN